MLKKREINSLRINQLQRHCFCDYLFLFDRVHANVLIILAQLSFRP